LLPELFSSTRKTLPHWETARILSFVVRAAAIVMVPVGREMDFGGLSGLKRRRSGI